jgi:hypothetical protein
VSNPYRPGGPLSEALLVGRDHELRELADLVRAGQSVSVVGPPGIGKSWLLQALPLAGGLGDDALLVRVDCAGLAGCGAAEAFGRLAARTAGVLVERGLPAEPAVDAAVAQPARLPFEAAVRALNRRGLSLALILDSFERLSANPLLDVSFFNALRSAAGRLGLLFVTASARPLIELTFAGRAQEIRSSPFFNIFAPLSLGLLPEGAARRLIREPPARAGRPFSPATEALFHELAGNHPLALQVACAHAWDVGDNRDELERRTLGALAGTFAAHWRELSPPERAGLIRVDELAARAMGDAEARQTLRDLAQQCLLVPTAAGYAYQSRAWAWFVSALAAPAGE